MLKNVPGAAGNIGTERVYGWRPVGMRFDDIDQGLAVLAARQHDIGIIGIRAHAAGALADRLDREVTPGSAVARDLSC